MKVFVAALVLSCLFICSETKIKLFYGLKPNYPFHLKEVFALLFSSQNICIWSMKGMVNERSEIVLSRLYTFYNYTFTHIMYGHGLRHTDATQCQNNVMFNMDFFYYRVLFEGEKPSENHVFLIIDTLGTDRKGVVEKLSLELLKILWTAKVVLLTEHEMYKLSSPYFPPRLLEGVACLKDLRDKRITDMRGREVNVATFNCSLFSILNGPMNSGFHDGIEMRLMQNLASHLNMTPNYIDADGWGWMFPNGTWNGGLAGMLQDGKAEVGYCNIWNTLRYNRVVALAPPWNQMYHSFMVPRPVLIHGYWMTVVQLFHGTVWFLFLMFCFLVTILFWKYKKSQSNNYFSDLVESILTVFGTFLGQTTYLAPSYIFGARLIVSWSIFSFFMSSVLNNMMISRLMVPHLSDKIDTVRDFVLGNYRWGEEAYSNFEREIFFDPANPWHKKMENRYLEVPSHKMMTALRSGKVGFPVQRLGNEYIFIVLSSIDQSEIDSYRIMKEPVNQFYVSIIFSKMSPLLEICRNPMLRFLQTGLVIHWKNEVIRKFGSPKAARLLNDPSGESVSVFEPLTINNNLAAFQILLYGWCLSLVVFVVELLWIRKLKVRTYTPKIPTREEEKAPYEYCN